MNYGVTVKGVEGKDYYGVLQEVIELEYVGATRKYKTVLFKCDWFDPDQGTRIYKKYHLVEVNHESRYPHYDPFVLAYQAQQVYYAPYPIVRGERSQWWAVVKVKARGIVETPMNEDHAYQEEVIGHRSLLEINGENVFEDIVVDDLVLDNVVTEVDEEDGEQENEEDEEENDDNYDDDEDEDEDDIN